MDQINWDENFNCIKFTNETKERLKSLLSPTKDKTTPLSLTKSDDTENFIQEPLNVPKPNPYRNIFQRIPPVKEPEIKTANSVVYKPKTNMKKAKKPKATVFITNDTVSLVKYAKGTIKFSMNFLWKSGELAAIYGTELIIQLIAITTVAGILLLKFLDRFLKNRHLENCISYVENINFSTLKFPNLNLDYIQMYKIIRRIVWILAKLVELFLVILKHFIIQAFLWSFFLISWLIYSLIQFVSSVILFPTVDKTFNMLKMDPNTISNMTKLQINRLLISLSITSQKIMPMTSDMLISIARFRHNIIKVNIIKSTLLDIYDSLKSILNKVLNIFRDASDFIMVLLEFHGIILGLVVLLCNTISMIGYFNYLMFLMMSYTGYVISIFMDILKTVNFALSRLRKV